MDREQTLYFRAGIPQRVAQIEYVPTIVGSSPHETQALTQLWQGLIADPKQLRDFPFCYVFLAALKPDPQTSIDHSPSTALGIFPIMKAAVLQGMKVLCLEAEQLSDFSAQYKAAKNPEIVMVHGLTRDAQYMRRHLNRVVLSNSHIFLCYDDDFSTFSLLNHPINFIWQFSSVNIYKSIRVDKQ